MKRSFLIPILSIGFAASAQAKPIPLQPVEIFTSAISSFYVVLNKCSAAHDDPAEIQSNINKIRSYVSLLYPTGIPYWALPESKDKIEDQDMCNYLLYENAMRYQQARRVYARANITNSSIPMPPQFYMRPPNAIGDGYNNQMLYSIDSRPTKRVDFDW